jgi:hypothetical protein
MSCQALKGRVGVKKEKGKDRVMAGNYSNKIIYMLVKAGRK